MSVRFSRRVTVYPNPDFYPDVDAHVWYVPDEAALGDVNLRALRRLLDKYESAGILDGYAIDRLFETEPADILAQLKTWYEWTYEDWLGGQEEHGGQGGTDPVYERQLRESR